MQPIKVDQGRLLVWDHNRGVTLEHLHIEQEIDPLDDVALYKLFIVPVDEFHNSELSLSFHFHPAVLYNFTDQEVLINKHKEKALENVTGLHVVGAQLVFEHFLD
jgi:hypothetical protein